MLKSERGPLKRQKRTPRANYRNELTRPLQRVFYRTKAEADGVFLSQRFTLERSFCTCEQRTKIKLFTGFSGIRVCVEYYASELLVNYRRTICEPCGSNWMGELHLCEEYKGLLGTNYANRESLASVGKLSRKTTSRAELTAKPKHNIKSFSKNQGATVPLRLRALTNKETK